MPSSPDLHPSSSPTVEEWSQLKALWFELIGAPRDRQQQRLAADDVSPALRAQLDRMLLAAIDVGDRFEVPAHSTLGGSSGTGGPTRLPSV